MMTDLFPRRRKRRIVELNIVPILDMLTTVIFFLLLSTGFMEYTKLTVPPSSTSIITDPLVPPPLSPKLMIFSKDSSMVVRLSWTGEHPGEKSEVVPSLPKEEVPGRILKASGKLIGDFANEHRSEKTLHLGLGSALPYQYLISSMDGVLEKMPDIVLISATEVDARARAMESSEVAR